MNPVELEAIKRYVLKKLVSDNKKIINCYDKYYKWRTLFRRNGAFLRIVHINLLGIQA